MAHGTSRARPFHVVAVMVAMLFFFSIGRYVPGFEWTFNFSVLLIPVLCCFFSKNSFPAAMRSTYVYVWLLVFVAPLWGAIMAGLVFGQPLWLGLLAQRGFMLVPFGIIVVSLIQRGNLLLSEIELGLVILSWLNLVICSIVLVFLEPNDFSDIGNLVTDGGGLYNQFNLPMPFIIFGAFYYFARGITKKGRPWLIVSFAFLFYIVGGNTGRVLNLAMVTSLIFLAGAFSSSGRGRRIRDLAIMLTAILLLIFAAIQIFPGWSEKLINKYFDAFAASTGAIYVDDWSANARILQFAISKPWIEENIFLGTGTISNHWHEGYKGLFDYFHPSDLGLLGIVFQYGIAGLLLFVFHYRLGWNAISALINYSKTESPPILLLAASGCLLTLLFSSVTTGSIAYNSELIIFYILLILSGVGQNSLTRQR